MVFSEELQELKAVPDTSRPTSLVKALWKEYRLPIICFIFARTILSLIAAIVAYSSFVAGEVSLWTYDKPILTDWEEALLGTWQHWDGLWYLKIAASGYNVVDYSPAFYPLYPLLIRLVAFATQSPLLDAGIAISTLAYFVALIFLWKLLALDFSDEIRRRVLLYLILFPTSYYFFAVYTESLFLAFAVAGFYFARKGNWLAAGFLGMLATLTRNTGLTMVLPFAIEYLRQQNFNLRRIRLDALAIGLIPLGVFIFMGYSWLTLDDPLAFSAAQIHWGRNFAPPWEALTNGWAKMFVENIPFMLEPTDHPFGIILYLSDQISNQVYNFAFAIFGLFLVIISLKILPPIYSTYALFGIAIPLFMPSQDMPLFSMPRFLLVLFPIFITLAMLVGRRVYIHRAILIVFAMLLLTLSIRYFAWYWVA